MSFGRKGMHKGVASPQPAQQATGFGSAGVNPSLANLHNSKLPSDAVRSEPSAEAADAMAAKRAAFIASERERSSNSNAPMTGKGWGEPASRQRSYNEPAMARRSHSAGLVAPGGFNARFFGDPAKRSTMVAYLLWMFFSNWSAHRFYLGAWQSGFMQVGLGVFSLLLVFAAPFIGFMGPFVGGAGLLVWIFWVFADLFLIPGLSRICVCLNKLVRGSALRAITLTQGQPVKRA